jgi:hypothetical protein
MSNIEISLNGSGNFFTLTGNSQIPIVPDSLGMSPQNNNLIYLFDPLYYKGYSISPTGNKNPYSESNLNNIYDTNSLIIPSNKYVKSRGSILNKTGDPFYLIRKGGISGTFFSYEKFNDDTDICSSRYQDRSINREYGVKERTNALLELTDPSQNTFNLLEEDTSKTFSCFIKLKGPVTHRSYGTSAHNKIIREKKGIFLNTKLFTLGYRSPYYRRKSSPFSLVYNVAYRYKFEPFSFVFSLKDASRNHTFMTDYLFKFNETYHLAITIECGSINVSNNSLAPALVKIYVNGSLVETAKLDFNPLIKGNKSSGLNSYGSRMMPSRNNISPIQPGFRKKNGIKYGSSQSHNIDVRFSIITSQTNNKLYLGKSNTQFIGKSYADNVDTNSEANTKRYLNNIDVGVIHIYKSALSQSDILQIYNNFSSRY